MSSYNNTTGTDRLNTTGTGTGIGGKIENAVEPVGHTNTGKRNLGHNPHHVDAGNNVLSGGQNVIEKVVGTETREFPVTYYDTEKVPVQREKIVNREVTEEVPVIREEARTVMVPVEDVEVRTRIVQETVPVTEYETRHVAKTKMESREVPVIQQYVPTETRVLEGAEVIHHATVGQKVKDVLTTESTAHTTHHTQTGPGTQYNTSTVPTAQYDTTTTGTVGQKPSLMQKVKTAVTNYK